MRELFFGDNLEVLADAIPAESVDLVYLDPPFNSQRSYNLLFSKRTDTGADAQVKAFDDTWAWGERAEREFAEVLQGSHAGAAQALAVLRPLLGESPLTAYLAMMTRRLVELHRVMKPTASLYLHCDGSASHYLKVVLDAVFGPGNFRNEIVWHYYNKYSAGKRAFGRNFDQILFYTKSDRYTFHPQRELRDKPQKQLLRENVGGVLKNKKGLDGKVMYREVTDKKVDAVWRMPCLQPASKEMLGYPTQKPLALLRRIVAASSGPGDVVLDPFCGCGTTVHAAEELGRSWIGIDISHLAICDTRKRLTGAFPDIDFTGLAPNAQQDLPLDSSATVKPPPSRESPAHARRNIA